MAPAEVNSPISPWTSAIQKHQHEPKLQKHPWAPEATAGPDVAMPLSRGTFPFYNVRRP